MTARNFEGRRFGDAHQAKYLAEWTGSATWSGDRITPGNLDPASPRESAVHGDWIILAADGTVRIEQGGSQAGYCTDCGLAVWWSHRDNEGLVTGGLDGTRWCYGPNESHFGMTHHHALPGMAQWVVRSPEGKVCHCLDRDVPHMHEIITDPPPRAHRLARARLDASDDILADLRVGDGYIPEYHLTEANRRLWDLLEREDAR